MNKDILIHITAELYKTTLLFPKKEPLRYKMRDVASDILANLIAWESLSSSNPGVFRKTAEERNQELVFEINKDLEILASFFEVADRQSWVSPSALLEVKAEYDKIRGDIGKEINNFETKKAVERLDIKDQVIPGNKSNKAVLVEEINKEIEIEREENENSVSQQANQTLNDSLNFRKEKILEFLKEKGRAQVWEINKIFPETSKRTLRRDFQQLLKQALIERIGERNETFYRLRGQEA